MVFHYSDLQTGACKDYENRSVNVPTCVQLTKERVAEFDWLPDTCAYRMIYRGQGLADWHPLVSGTHCSLNKAHVGLSSIPVVVDCPGIDYEDFIIDKP